jgi:hypothetical protein
MRFCRDGASAGSRARYHPPVSRAGPLSALVLVLLLTTGCWPAAPSQPLTAAPTATAGARPTPKPATTANGNATVKPAAASAKPSPQPALTKEGARQAAAPSPTPAAASAKPTAKPSPPPALTKEGAGQAAPGPNGAASPPAVVATAVAGLPAVPAAPAAKPAAGDALGVAASANAAAAATTSDAEATALCGPGAILSTRAGQAAGRPATVAIARVDGSYQANVRGQPTFLNDAPYPSHTFTAVIWGSDRRQFNPPPEGAWQGKALCVTGPVELFQQRPQIVVSSPSQLRAAR